jgi:hypothetical protein
MRTLMLLLMLVPAAEADEHLPVNPVYRQLIEKGVRVAEGDFVPLPAPTLRDAMDAKAEQVAIAAIPDRHVPVDQLLRKSVVAPIVFRFREVGGRGRKTPVQGVDVWFVVYGQLDSLTRKDFLEEAMRTKEADAKQEGAKHKFLTAQELQARKIAPPSDDKKERYVYAMFPLMEKVELSLTSRTYTARTARSLVYAADMDQRFAADREFANQWRPIERGEEGSPKLGSAVPYEGAACYVKITQLADPPDALLIEQHTVFVEPKDWFHGANLLRSKLPVLIQSEVRKFRRQLAKDE